MAFSVSPAVIVRELDDVAGVSAVSTSVGAIAGPALWGPTGEAVLVSSEKELSERFGKPTGFNAETFFAAADYLAYANALYLVRTTDGAARSIAASSPFEAKYEGALGNALRVSVVSSSAAYEDSVAAVGDLTGTVDFFSTSIEFEATADLTADLIVGSIARIGNASVGYQDLVIASVTATETGGVWEHTVSFTERFALLETDLSEVSISRRWEHFNITSKAPSTGNVHIVVSDRSGAITGVAGTVLEVFENVSLTESARLEDGTSNFYRTRVDGASNWIRTTSTIVVAGATANTYNLAGGLDGNGENTTTPISFAAVAQGYDLFADADQLDISFVLQGKARGGASGTGLANYIIANVAEKRKDCMVLVSPSAAITIDQSNPNTKLSSILAFRAALQNSSYWVMDTGYKYRYDKYNDVYRWVPLNGDIAGLCARVEPWESPASNGAIKNVIRLDFSPNKAQRDVLYGADINPVIESAIGQGIILFGDKTGVGTDSPFNRINVRRLFIHVQKAIARSSYQFLFKANDNFTQTQFKNMVEPFLRDIRGRRGIVEFRVVTDVSINTPDVVDANTFKAAIFIIPPKSINFIELTFVPTRSGAVFEEIVGSTSI